MASAGGHWVKGAFSPAAGGGGGRSVKETEANYGAAAPKVKSIKDKMSQLGWSDVKVEVDKRGRYRPESAGGWEPAYRITGTYQPEGRGDTLYFSSTVDSAGKPIGKPYSVYGKFPGGANSGSFNLTSMKSPQQALEFLSEKSPSYGKGKAALEAEIKRLGGSK